MKKRKKNKKYLYVVLLGLLIIISIYYLLTNSTSLDITKGLSASLFYKSNSNNKDVINAEIKNLNKEIDNLKKINKLDSLVTDKITINASVIKRSTPYWHNFITINKGSKDKIKKGYAVMNNNGLVGEVIIVNKNTSEVKLITNQDNNYISAKFNYKDKDYYGIIDKYNIIKNELYLENVIGDLDDNVKGIDVVTSGLSSNMPSGLLIGKINSIKKDKYNLSNTIILKLNNDINDLDIVKVVGKHD